jgi:hypothetical protein
MTDVLVRGLADETLSRVDAHAHRQGLARVEYLRRLIEADAARVTEHVSTPADWRRFAALTADLRRPGFEERAWGHGE